MRPRKVILMFDRNSLRRSLNRLRLQVWGYRVVTCSSADQVQRLAATRLHPVEGEPRLLIADTHVRVWIPKIRVDAPSVKSPDDLRSVVQHLCKRTRGPRQHFRTAKWPLPVFAAERREA